MTSHEFARQLLAGPDLPLAFRSSVLGCDPIAPPVVSPIRAPVAGEVLECLLIEPEVVDDLDELTSDDDEEFPDDDEEDD